MKWTAEQVPRLDGKTIVITGGNSGIGFEAAKVCVAKGADVVIACRNSVKAEDAVSRLNSDSDSGLKDRGAVESMQLDLANLDSVRRFASALSERSPKLDLLVNNAGVMMCPYGTTDDGFETQMGVNHLGHFALTGLLLGPLSAADHARVVNVSSNGHKLGKMDYDDLLFEGGKNYSPTRAYTRSKLANLLFTFELQRRFAAAGVTTIATVAHPGGADTDLARHMEGKWYYGLVKPIALAFVVQSAEMGALPTLRAMVEPGLEGGEYFGPSGFQEQRGNPVRVGSSRASSDSASARKLWELSEELTGVSYAWP